MAKSIALLHSMTFGLFVKAENVEDAVKSDMMLNLSDSLPNINAGLHGVTGIAWKVHKATEKILMEMENRIDAAKEQGLSSSGSQPQVSKKVLKRPAKASPAPKSRAKAAKPKAAKAKAKGMAGS